MRLIALPILLILTTSCGSEPQPQPLARVDDGDEEGDGEIAGLNGVYATSPRSDGVFGLGVVVPRGPACAFGTAFLDVQNALLAEGEEEDAGAEEALLLIGEHIAVGEAWWMISAGGDSLELDELRDLVVVRCERVGDLVYTAERVEGVTCTEMTGIEDEGDVRSRVDAQGTWQVRGSFVFDDVTDEMNSRMAQCPSFARAEDRFVNALDDG